LDHKGVRMAHEIIYHPKPTSIFPDNNGTVFDWVTDSLDKRNFMMAKAMGLIFSMFNVISAQDIVATVDPY